MSWPARSNAVPLDGRAISADFAIGNSCRRSAASAVEATAPNAEQIDVDVLAIQEAEDIDTLHEFVRNDLDGLYPNVVLVEGNDPRLIDVGLLSKLPLGPITSWQTT